MYKRKYINDNKSINIEININIKIRILLQYNSQNSLVNQ